MEGHSSFIYYLLKKINIKIYEIFVCKIKSRYLTKL